MLFLFFLVSLIKIPYHIGLCSNTAWLCVSCLLVGFLKFFCFLSSIAAAIFSSGGTRADQKGKAGVKEAPKVYEDIIMTLVEPTSKTVLGMGHTIDIKLRAGSNLKWNFDKEYKSLEFISERTEDGFVHAVFKAKEPGRETVYFDCLDVGDPLNVKVLETKLISVKVE